MCPVRAHVTSAQPLCMWESCFPTSFDAWKAARAEGGRCGHFLVTFVVVRIADGLAECHRLPRSDECDGACWVPLHEVAEALCDGRRDHVDLTYADVTACVTDEGAESRGSQQMIPGALLSGVYPNAAHEGVGRGHLYALRQLLAARAGDSSSDVVR